MLSKGVVITSSIVLTLGLVFILVKTGLIYLPLFLFMPIDEEVFSSSMSPNKHYEAVGIYRDAGATANTATIVSIHPTESVFERPRRILVIDGKFPVHIEWKSDAHLDLRIVGGLDERRVVINEHNWKEITITSKWTS